MTDEVIQDRQAPIGVLGFGDLGKRLAAQILSSGHAVMIFDPYIEMGKDHVFGKAVDPAVDLTNLGVPTTEVSASGVLQRSHIVHWAVPSGKLDKLPMVPSDCTVVLHDSVMANSEMALGWREDNNQFVFAHCLMNDTGRVLVSNEHGNHQVVSEHFKDIGLAPKLISVKQHDTLMARTQGVLALIIQLGLREELDHGFAAGDLTPSALELREAVIKREANWTKHTLQSILSNPELKPFVDEMAELLASRSGE